MNNLNREFAKNHAKGVLGWFGGAESTVRVF